MVMPCSRSGQAVGDRAKVGVVVARSLDALPDAHWSSITALSRR